MTKEESMGRHPAGKSIVKWFCVEHNCGGTVGQCPMCEVDDDSEEV